MLPSLSVIIINYNTADLISTCLQSVLKQKDQAQSIVVVDNNSIDNSVSILKQYRSDIELIVNPDNVGFGVANNIAVASIDSELLFFLNPDTVLHDHCLEQIRCFMVREKDTGLAGVRIFDKDGSNHDSFEYSYPGSNYADGVHDNLPGKIAWVLGAGMVVRKDVFEKIKGFDDDFFLYGEDIDISLRVRKNGWNLGFIAKADITHLEGQSERFNESNIVLEKKTKAELLFFKKHYPVKIINKIKRARCIQAIWRIITLKCSFPFNQQKKCERQYKLMKYKTVLRLYSS